MIVRGSARAPQYAAAKYGLLGRTKSYAHAFAPKVRVNTFAPGFMETEATLAREDWQSGRADQLRSMTPMGHIQGPAEMAGTALFLATDDATHMTGGYMVADGGYNMVGAEVIVGDSPKPSADQTGVRPPLTKRTWPPRREHSHGG